MDTLEKDMIHIPGGTEQDSERFHHATKNFTQFKTHELFLKCSIYFWTGADQR